MLDVLSIMALLFLAWLGLKGVLFLAHLGHAVVSEVAWDYRGVPYDVPEGLDEATATGVVCEALLACDPATRDLSAWGGITGNG